MPGGGVQRPPGGVALLPVDPPGGAGIHRSAGVRWLTRRDGCVYFDLSPDLPSLDLPSDDLPLPDLPLSEPLLPLPDLPSPDLPSPDLPESDELGFENHDLRSEKSRGKDGFPEPDESEDGLLPEPDEPDEPEEPDEPDD